MLTEVHPRRVQNTCLRGETSIVTLPLVSVAFPALLLCFSLLPSLHGAVHRSTTAVPLSRGVPECTAAVAESRDCSEYRAPLCVLHSGRAPFNGSSCSAWQCKTHTHAPIHRPANSPTTQTEGMRTGVLSTSRLEWLTNPRWWPIITSIIPNRQRGLEMGRDWKIKVGNCWSVITKIYGYHLQFQQAYQYVEGTRGKPRI